MILQNYRIKTPGRFAALLGRAAPATDLHDQILLETPEWVVAPTLGAIVPNWLIAIPRQAALNFKGWQRKTGCDPTTVVTQVANHLQLSFDKIIWFEHGPQEMGTTVGCGVDYAHLHILFDPAFTIDELMDQARASTELPWQQCSRELAYSALPGERSYLVVGSGERVFYASDVDATGSQFLRRAVASTVGAATAWNYKLHPHHENVALTVETFRARQQAAG